MNSRCAILLLVAGVLTGCPYDRLRPPYFQNDTDMVVEARIVLTDGTQTAFMLGKGNRLLYSANLTSISKVTFIAGDSVIEEIDSERIATMLRCTQDPRDVTWYIEAKGLRPSVSCHSAVHDAEAPRVE